MMSTDVRGPSNPVERPTAAFVVSLLAGLGLLARGTMMNRWGHGGIASGVALLFGMGGLVAEILGLVGGALAVGSRSSTAPKGG